MKFIFQYGIDQLTTAIVMDIVAGKIKGELNQEAIVKINACRQKVEKMASSEKAVYGINTGFGPLCDTQISPDETSKLQENLLITHAVGVGNPISPELS